MDLTSRKRTRRFLHIIRRNSVLPGDRLSPRTQVAQFAHRYVCDRYFRMLERKRHYKAREKLRISNEGQEYEEHESK